MKKNILLSLALILAIVFFTKFALADDQKGGEDSNKNSSVLFQNDSKDNKSSEDVNKDGQDSQGESESEDIGEDGASSSEDSLNSVITNLPDLKNTVQVKEADSSTINTYADLVTLLNQYQTAIDTINSTTGVTTSNLSPAEQQLLQTLSKKDSFELGRSKTRLTEVSTHIKDLISLLTPLGSQTITENYGLKSLLLSTVNEIAGNINDSASLHDQADQVLEAETD